MTKELVRDNTDIILTDFNFIVLDDTAGTKRIACADTTNEDLLGSVRSVDADTSDATASFAVQVSDEFHQIILSYRV